MSKKILSIFIDESGDFGAYHCRSPFYLVTMVLHDQRLSITENIHRLETHLQNLDYPPHAIHTGPLIRRESIYLNDHIQERKRLFHALFHFSRKLDFHYLCIAVKKNECPDAATMTAKLSKALSDILQTHHSYFVQFERIIIYYDNGQTELTQILTSVFQNHHPHAEFRKVKPADYKLFQVADLICTLELLAHKSQIYSFSNSETKFFGSIRDFRKNYLKPLRKKHL